MNTTKRNIIIISLATLGLISITSGTILNFKEQKKDTISTSSKLVLSEKVAITPVDQTIKVNQALPTKVSDYIKEKLTSDILEKIKLDTSKVDISKAGTYEFILTYKNEQYKGTVTVEEVVIIEEVVEESTVIDKITLKDITIKKGGVIPTDISSYIVETLDPETLASMQLALPSSGITNQTGTYTYNIKFNNMLYTGTITIEEDQSLIQKAEIIEKDTDPSTEITTSENDSTEENTENQTN